MTTTQTDRIFLIGPMGVGKSSIGRQLAQALGYEFLDSDQEIEKRCGADIAWIFDVEGEQGFREREAAIIEELSMRHNVVLATGGGSVLSEQNRRLLCERGVVIYLRASLETLLQRTEKDRKRPLLQNTDRRKTLERILRERGPLYEQIAHLSISTEDKGMQNIIKEILLHAFRKKNPKKTCSP